MESNLSFNLDRNDESKPGIIISIIGNLISANSLYGSSMFEMVYIGKDELVGEIIKISDDTATIQVFEDITGLTVGDIVKRSFKPLMVELGPGIMGSYYDALQRPLDAIVEKTKGSPYIAKGLKVNSLNREKKWIFEPINFKIGDIIVGGDIYGKVVESGLIVHWIMLPPKVSGNIIKLVERGEYTVENELLQIKDSETDSVKSFNMIQYWPIRIPRPILEKLPVTSPLTMGIRAIDSLFPMGKGSTCAIPGGMGKSTILHFITKHSNSDAIVYIGCGERGNEVAELLMELPELYTIINGVEVSTLNKVCLITNTSNMSVAGREASIYSGLSIAEYLRDMGNDVTVAADSLTRWAEALNEISRNLKEIPVNGYPSYLNSRIQQFFTRSGKVTCIGNPKRQGSISILGSVSPPGGDYSNDPVAQATLNSSDTLWSMSVRLAQIRHFPSISWTQSYSNFSTSAAYKEYTESESQNENYIQERNQIIELLAKEEEIKEIVQQFGKDTLSEHNKLIIEVARIFREEFLQQNMFTPYDKYCPFYKLSWMARNFILFYQLAKNEISLSNDKTKITYLIIKKYMNDKGVLPKIYRMKFMDPSDGKTTLVNSYESLNHQIIQSFKDFHIEFFFSNH